MTREEMCDNFYSLKGENNYKEAQERIREAMENGEKYVYLPGKNCESEFNWCATIETIQRLREDGFDVDVVWQPFEYWSIEWGY